MNDYVMALLPEVLMIVCGVACIFMGISNSEGIRRLVPWTAFMGVAGVVVASVWVGNRMLQEQQVIEVRGLLVGSLTIYVRMITMMVGSVLILVNWHQPDASERGEYFSMILFSMAGVSLVASSNDLIMLFFALEIVSVPTYILVAISRRDIRAQEASSKYFFLGALAAAMTAYGLSFLYGVSGSTTLFGPGSIAAHIASGKIETNYLLVGMLLTFGGLCFKIAAVPFHSYVGDVYQGAASPVTGLLAFMPKLAGFVGMIHLFGLLRWELPETLGWAVWAVAAMTMTAGNVLALMQSNVKRMLAYSSIAHSGYMLVGLLVGPTAGSGPLHDGLSAVLFYTAVYGIMNLGAFSVLTYLSRRGDEVENIEQLDGLARREPMVALAMAICMFSLMGMPPTAGFLGKAYIFSSAFAAGTNTVVGDGLIYLAVIGVLNSAIGAAYYLRVVGRCYLKDSQSLAAPASHYSLQVGTAVCAMMMIALFLWPKMLLIQAQNATAGLASLQSEALPMAHSLPNILPSVITSLMHM